MDSDMVAYFLKMGLNLLAGLLLSWSVGLLPALIYRYGIYKAPIEKKKVVWRLAPPVIILMFVFKLTAASLSGEPPKGNPLPWIIIYYIGKWIMTRNPKQKKAAVVSFKGEEKTPITIQEGAATVEEVTDNHSGSYSEEELYARAAQEVETKKVSPGIMAKAIAEADGDDKKAVARYIKYRVAQLAQEITQNIARQKEEAAARQRETDRKRAEEDRQRAMDEAVARKRAEAEGQRKWDEENKRERKQFAILFCAVIVVVLVIAVGIPICKNTVDNVASRPLADTAVQKAADSEDDKRPLAYETLHEAAKCGDLADVKRHLQRGGIVNAWKDSLTPLHEAARAGQFETVKFLVANGANVNACTTNELTPLHIAVSKSHLDMVKFLVAKGANVNARDKEGRTPLDDAVFEGNGEILKSLMASGATLNAVQCDETDMYKAINRDQPDVVKFLVAKGANVNAEDDKCTFFSPLGMAVSQGNLDIVTFLVAKGANVNARDKEGQTPLHYAAHEGRVDIVKFLVANGANLSAVKEALLHEAATGGHLEVIQLLVAKGADLNAAKNTMLHEAAMFGHLAVVKFLVANGANVNHNTSEWSSPLHNAVVNGTAALYEAYDKQKGEQAKEVERRFPLDTGELLRRLEVVRFLVASGANVNARDKEGKTPLREAAHYDHLEMVEFLKQHGATE